jgi:hypothetical protein
MSAQRQPPIRGNRTLRIEANREEILGVYLNGTPIRCVKEISVRATADDPWIDTTFRIGVSVLDIIDCVEATATPERCPSLNGTDRCALPAGHGGKWHEAEDGSHAWGRGADSSFGINLRAAVHK